MMLLLLAEDVEDDEADEKGDDPVGVERCFGTGLLCCTLQLIFV